MAFCARIRGILRAHSWHFARAFVAFCSRTRSILHAHSWFFACAFGANFRVFFAQTFVVFCSNLRGFMVAELWGYPKASYGFHGFPGVFRNMVRGWGGDYYTDDTCCFGSMAGVTRHDILKAE